MNSRNVKRQMRIRKNIKPSVDRPRLSVHRSNRYVYAQIITIDGQSICGLSEKVITEKGMSRIDQAQKLGREIAKLAAAKKITEVVFDKGRFAYHGKIKAIAEGAREGGLKF